VLSADPELTSLVLVTTCLAASAGALAAMFTSWFLSSKPDLSMSLNGILAGLVGITAGADVVSPAAAALIGAIAGVVVVFSVIALDRIKIDDPVGAISVHLTCGVWGTLAVGIFSTNPEHSFMTQLLGVGAYGLFAFGAAAAIFGALKLTVGIRVSEEEELEGLDLAEHGSHAYDFDLGSAVTHPPLAASPAAPAGVRLSTLATDER
jgi:Amt family ammonium transporter